MSGKKDIADFNVQMAIAFTLLLIALMMAYVIFLR